MILYHFTAGPYLRAISKYGLTVGDVPTDLKRWKGRIGVWLTSPERAGGTGLKDRARQNSIPPFCRSTARYGFIGAMDGLGTAERYTRHNQSAASQRNFIRDWYVYFGVVRPDRIVECMDTVTGRRLMVGAKYSRQD
jgi:hypothetical protein